MESLTCAVYASSCTWYNYCTFWTLKPCFPGETANHTSSAAAGPPSTSFTRSFCSIVRVRNYQMPHSFKMPRQKKAMEPRDESLNVGIQKYQKKTKTCSLLVLMGVCEREKKRHRETEIEGKRIGGDWTQKENFQKQKWGLIFSKRLQEQPDLPMNGSLGSARVS